MTFPGARSGRDVRDYLNNRFVEYLDFLDSMDSPDSAVARIVGARDKIQELAIKLLDCVDSIYTGHPHMAYAKIDDAIQSVRSYLQTRKHIQGRTVAKPERVLSSADRAEPKFRRGDCSHSLGQREKVGAQRLQHSGIAMSVPMNLGIPLLGGIGRPNWETMHVARFEVLEERELRMLLSVLTPIYTTRAIDR